MSAWLGAFLIGFAVIGSVVISIAVPALFGLIVWDLASSRRPKGAINVTEVADARMAISFKRTIARGFVIAGGAFWSIAGFAGLYIYRDSGWTDSFVVALIPLVACAATIIIGWYFERVAAALLALASIAVVAWGVIYQFDVGTWGTIVAFLVGPMLTASVLFWLARRDQEALELALSLRPELQPAFAESKTL